MKPVAEKVILEPIALDDSSTELEMRPCTQSDIEERLFQARHENWKDGQLETYRE